LMPDLASFDAFEAPAPRGEREILEHAKQIRANKADAQRNVRVERIAEISKGNAEPQPITLADKARPAHKRPRMPARGRRRIAPRKPASPASGIPSPGER
jgi:hypothetical protein